MRTARRNKQRMMYALLDGTYPEYALDANGDKIIDYTDEQGNVHYLETGNEIITYFAPVEFYANISLNAGETQQTEYGIDISSYDASVTYLRKEFPITETTLIWFETEPVFKDGHVDPKTADFKVVSVKPSLNYEKILLSKLVK